jgi:GAF domain-containing protein
MILLISPQDDLLDVFTAALPATTPLVRLASLAAAHSYIQSQTNPPTLIIFDTQASPDTAADCSLISQDEFFGDVPLIAIIADREDCQAVLEAGADDFLLLPLLPAEISVRLVHYLHSTARGFTPLVEAINKITNLASSAHTLNQGIKSLAEIFDAAAAWVVLFESEEDGFTLAGSFDLPSSLQQNSEKIHDQTKTCLEILEQSQSNVAQIIPCSYLAGTGWPETSGLTHLICTPLRSGQRSIGLLNLAYPHEPQMLRAEKRMLARLGQEIGILLDLLHQQQETQTHATETAFIVLIARVLNERLDLNTSLSLTLEQAVTLLNASGGDIWLMSADRQWLDLASSLTSVSVSRPFSRRPRGKGLVGWVVEYCKVLHTR